MMEWMSQHKEAKKRGSWVDKGLTDDEKREVKWRALKDEPGLFVSLPSFHSVSLFVSSSSRQIRLPTIAKKGEEGKKAIKNKSLFSLFSIPFPPLFIQQKYLQIFYNILCLSKHLLSRLEKTDTP